jgi:predicted nucleotidyltransferase
MRDEIIDHTLPSSSFARGQHWRDCDGDVRAFGTRVVETFGATLSEELVGVYLHGSLAHGCYRRAKSDIDLLIVVRGSLTVDKRRELALLCVALSDARPTVGDLELSVIQAAHAWRFTHPLPYELHYGTDHREKILRGEFDYASVHGDRDLAAHCTIVRARGVALAGPPVAEVFGAVPWTDFLDAVLDDFAWIVADEHILESPFYAVLNACRVLQLLKEGAGTIASKEEGALWARAHLPTEHHAIIQQALDCYCSAQTVTPAQRKTGGIVWDAAALRRFRAYAARAVAAAHGADLG